MGKVWGNAKGGWRKQRRSVSGQFARGLGSAKLKNVSGGLNSGVVSYSRHSLRGHSAGFNAGTRISAKNRISVGGYVKVERTGPTRIEKRLKKADQDVSRLVDRIAPHPVVGTLAKSAISQKSRRALIDATLGGEKQIGPRSFARLSTSQNALPVLTIEHNRKRKRDQQARRRATWAYNDSVNKKAVQGKKARPQRRGQS